LFTTTTTPGLAMDGIFYYTGRGLNWICTVTIPSRVRERPAHLHSRCEWLQHRWHCVHKSTIEGARSQQAASASVRRCSRWRPSNLPDVNILTNGAWYGEVRTGTKCTTARQAPREQPHRDDCELAGGEAGFAFMWHSHNEREITPTMLPAE
jgi:hypothetical protein